MGLIEDVHMILNAADYVIIGLIEDVHMILNAAERTIKFLIICQK